MAGILAALEAAANGASVALVDHAIPAAEGKLGGFAKFSGAKFSKLPAGQGLIPIAGSEHALALVADEAFEILGLAERAGTTSSDRILNSETLTLRAYDSILLTPHEIDELVARCEARLARRVTVFKSRAITVNDGNHFEVVLEGQEVLRSKFLLLAAGRQGAEFARELGALEQNGKGFDVGVRIEFLDGSALSKLRSLGPDAKILEGKCRTFCLNAPGEIYRYPFYNFTIPGGIVAEQNFPRANVGILRRVEGKVNELPRIIEKIRALPPESFSSNPFITGGGLGDKAPYVNEAFGKEIALELDTFTNSLSESGLITLSREHAVHFPLIDWHWPVYATPKSHRTTVENLYVAGDIAGHARGLLQAAVSGILAAREIGCAK